MRIGIDLDQCVFGFPAFFAAMINAMLNAGHTFLVTSNHFMDKREEDKQKLQEIGIDPEKLDWSLMPDVAPVEGFDGPQHKRWMADQCDYIFDDFARLNQLTMRPVFVVPAGKAKDKKAIT